MFEELFLSNDTVNYKGFLLKLIDRIKLKKSKSIIEINFIKTDSLWLQGIGLDTKGTFEIDNKLAKNSIGIWENTAPKNVNIVVNSKNQELIVFNMWKTADGTVHYWHNGAAMYVEQEGNKRIYHCNDGYPDDDLNDLIFSLEILD